jgi:hypothetical protein
MTDERGIGPLPVPGATSSRPSLVPGEGPLGLRLAGAALGAILAALAIAITVRLDALVWPISDASPIGVVFGPDGLAKGQPIATVLVWAVGPVAAAIAGFVFAGPATRHVDGSGLWMGSLTYLSAILIAPVVLIPDALRDGAGMFLRNLGVIPFVWMFAGVALGPLLVVCLVAGPIWATVLRLTTGGPARGGPSAGSLPIWPVVALTVLVLLGFAIVIAAFGAIGGPGGALVD